MPTEAARGEKSSRICCKTGVKTGTNGCIQATLKEAGWKHGSKELEVKVEKEVVEVQGGTMEVELGLKQ
jgi:type I site-specific restriction endonuclease